MKLAEVRRIPTVVNVICFLIVVAVSAVLLLKPLHATHRGFFCDDEAIRFPYRSNTISVELLVVTSFVPAVFMVFLLETIYGFLTARYTSGKDGAIVDTSRSEGLRSGLERSGLIVACLFYGNCLCYSLTEIVKLSFGTLRPSFLSACQPATDVTSFPNCSGWFIEDIVCQNTDVKLLIDMRKSFLSGHASFAVFNMLFIIFYLQRRLPSSTPRLAVSLLQTVAAGYALFVCATRIYDHYHYPGDVVGGSVLGIVCSWVTMFKICPAFIRHPPRTQVDFLPTSVITTQGAKQGNSAPPTSVTTKE